MIRLKSRCCAGRPGRSLGVGADDGRMLRVPKVEEVISSKDTSLKERGHTHNHRRGDRRSHQASRRPRCSSGFPKCEFHERPGCGPFIAAMIPFGSATA